MKLETNRAEYDSMPLLIQITVAFLMGYIRNREWGKTQLSVGNYKRQRYRDVIMSAMASQITSVLIVCSNVCSGADQGKHQNPRVNGLCEGDHRWPVDSHHQGPVTRKMFPFDDVIMNKTANRTTNVNTLRHSNTYLRSWTGSSLVQIMACCLFGAKPLS